MNDFLNLFFFQSIRSSLIYILNDCGVMMYLYDNLFLITLQMQVNSPIKRAPKNKSPVWFYFHFMKIDHGSRRICIKTANNIALRSYMYIIDMVSTRIILLNSNKVFWIGNIQKQYGLCAENKISEYLLLFSQNVPVHPGWQPNSQTPLNLLQPWQFCPQASVQLIPYRPDWHAKYRGK